MERRSRVLGLVLLSASLAAAQPIQPGRTFKAPGPINFGGSKTFREVLQERGVPWITPALMKALHNPDPVVRTAAAHVLAEERGKDAIPSLAEALVAEELASVQIALAYSLARFDDTRGVRKLDALCLDKSLSPRLRADAARAKFAASSYTHGGPARREVLFGLLAGWSTAGRIAALDLVPLYADSGLSPQDVATVTEFTTKSLTSATDIERASSAFALGRLGNPRAIPNLQDAVASETNGAVRAAMTTALRTLREKQAK